METDPDDWRPYCDDEMSSYEDETAPDEWATLMDEPTDG